jgi:DMSO/TMAO reductase YedYZ molybdopterin-dependent catalytic subunit
MARLDARRTNLGVFAVVIASTITGFTTFLAGSRSTWWLFWLHGTLGFALVSILWWKGKVILRGLRSSWPSTSAVLSVVTLGILFAIIGSGVYSAMARGGKLGPWGMLEVHVGGAMIIIPLFVVHLMGRWVPPAKRDLSRRVLLRASALGAAGLALRAATEGVTRVAHLAGSHRRFTGSHRIGGPGEPFPDVAWLFDHPDPVSPASWRLRVGGHVNDPFALTYEALGAEPSEQMPATIDCTGGWFSEQAWTGVRLGALLDRAGVKPGARSVRVTSVTGYARSYPIAEARNMLLATRVAGEPLTHGHGFPARVVAPGRRGFWWVKWVRSIEASEAPSWLQPPIPLQ